MLQLGFVGYGQWHTTGRSGPGVNPVAAANTRCRVTRFRSRGQSRFKGFPTQRRRRRGRKVFCVFLCAFAPLRGKNYLIPSVWSVKIDSYPGFRPALESNKQSIAV